MANDLTALCDRFAELMDRKAELDTELDGIKKEMEGLKPGILELMQETGVSKMRLDKWERTVFLHRQLWAGAKDGDKEGAMQALRDSGLSELIYETFSTQSLSRHVRDMAQEQDVDIPSLPPEMEKGIKVIEKFDIRANKS